jgi:excinuclease ABC subunit A
MSDANAIQLWGARQHTLQNIDVNFPRNQITVITGVSGSGKSSLAFSTLYAEGQRRFIETLPLRSRQQFELLEPPDFDRLEGLTPTLAVKQSQGLAFINSTISSYTEIQYYLKRIYSRYSVPFDFKTKVPLNKVSPIEVVEKILNLSEGLKLAISCQLRVPEGQEYYFYQQLQQAGVLRKIQGDQIVELEGSLQKGQVVEVVLDRLILKNSLRGRLMESVQQALKIGGYNVKVWDINQPESIRLIFSDLLQYRQTDGVLRAEYLVPEEFRLNSITTLNQGEDEIVEKKYSAEVIYRKIDWGEKSGWLNYPEFLDLTLKETKDLLKAQVWKKQVYAVLKDWVEQVIKKLNVLLELGLGHLPLSRSCYHLSTGEWQRLRLAKVFEKDLSGITYIIDEPSLGLGRKEIDWVIVKLKKLAQQGNTIIVVEHDWQIIEVANHVVELGEGAGQQGGKVIFQGDFQHWKKKPLDIKKHKAARTNKSRIYWTLPEIKTEFRVFKSVQLPKGEMIGITGDSGAGKSLFLKGIQCWGDESAEGFKVALIDQSPLSKNSRSLLATCTSIFDPLRELFADLPLSRARGYKIQRFSFNTVGGRCENCKGIGYLMLDELLMTDHKVKCEVCNGQRYSFETLEVLFKGKNIAQILDMEIQEAAVFFQNIPKIASLLNTLEECGLGYLKLGTPVAELSGGESQRVKLSTVITNTLQSGAEKILILDEPTAGLSEYDIGVMVKIFKKIIHEGHTLIIAEHDPMLLSECDFVYKL